MDETGKLQEFSLIGGPLHRLGRRVGLVRGKANSAPLGLMLGWIPWLILVALAMIEGAADKLFSLSLIAGHARLLIVIPLFFMCETSLDSRLTEFVRMIARSGIVSGKELPALAFEVARARRWNDSWLPEAVCLLATAIMSLSAAQLHMVGKTSALHSTHLLAAAPLTGLWYWLFCLPLFRFLMLRWLWRIVLWWFFLWRVSKLDLRLVATHPDGVAGLGYLEVVQIHFTPLVLAISIVVSASFAEEISTGESAFEVVYPALAFTLLMDLALFLGPPCVFFFKLRNCQENGLSDYMAFAERYVSEFQRKWLNAEPGSQEPLLGTADLQSLADLSNSVAIVRNMRWAPISARLATAIVAAALAPMLPLYFFKYPVAKVAEAIFRKLTGL